VCCAVSDDDIGEEPVNLSRQNQEDANLDEAFSAQHHGSTASSLKPHYVVEEGAGLAYDHSMAICAFSPTPKNLKPRRRCFMCLKKGLRKDTRWFCGACPSKPPLCMSKGCFVAYHSQLLVVNL
jgi:hypothetical protein